MVQFSACTNNKLASSNRVAFSSAATPVAVAVSVSVAVAVAVIAFGVGFGAAVGRVVIIDADNDLTVLVF